MRRAVVPSCRWINYSVGNFPKEKIMQLKETGEVCGWLVTWYCLYLKVVKHIVDWSLGCSLFLSLTMIQWMSFDPMFSYRVHCGPFTIMSCLMRSASHQMSFKISFMLYLTCELLVFFSCLLNFPTQFSSSKLKFCPHSGTGGALMLPQWVSWFCCLFYAAISVCRQESMGCFLMLVFYLGHFCSGTHLLCSSFCPTSGKVCQIWRASCGLFWRQWLHIYRKCPCPQVAQVAWQC